MTTTDRKDQMENPNVSLVRAPDPKAICDQLQLYMDTRESIEAEIEAAEPEAQAVLRAKLDSFKAEYESLWKAAVQNVEAAVLWVRRLEAQEAYCRETGAAYYQQAARLSAVVDRCSAEFGGWMKENGVKNIEAPTGKIHAQNYPVVLVLDQERVPDDLCRWTAKFDGDGWAAVRGIVEMVATSIEREPSLTAIQQALEAGRDLSGIARMDPNPRARGLKTPKKKK